jgi:hypothetical protein
VTTSTEAAHILRAHLEAALLDDLGPTVVTRVEVLEPAEQLLGAGHAALVIHLTTGERFGMEVCPFPRLAVMPSGSLQGMHERDPHQNMDRYWELDRLTRFQLIDRYKELTGGQEPPAEWSNARVTDFPRSEVICAIIDLEPKPCPIKIGHQPHGDCDGSPNLAPVRHSHTTRK